MSDWQPIETAPRDGTSVLIAAFDEGEYCPVVAFFQEDLDDDEWLEEGWIGVPTHWQPLPEPPKV